MCGIFGAYYPNGGLCRAALAAMESTLVHRGPDGAGTRANDNAAIGNRRLSIIDIEGGSQPMTSDSGRISVVQNGEIFNYIELKSELEARGVTFRTKSDTEVILRLYEMDGPTFASRLNGMFAIAVHDEDKDALFLYRDRLGVKPLYLARLRDGFVFASEIKALLAYGVPRKPHFEALHHFLSFNYVPPPFTMFQGIECVMPGERVCLSKRGIERTRWWRLSDFTQDYSLSESEIQETLLDLLENATRIRLRADVPVGAFLSGGIDSSSVVALMSRHCVTTPLTFSIGFEDERYDETAYAVAVAKTFGTKHVGELATADIAALWPLVIYYCDQPHGDVSFMPTYMVSSLAARHLKVVLTGDGGDELFAGYEKYRNFFAGSVASSEEAFQRNYFASISLMSEGAKRRLYGADLRASLSDLDSFDAFRHVFAEAQGHDQINQALYFDQVMLLPGNNLTKPDRMGMAASLEARTPYLDYRMVEFAMTIPGNLKLRNGETKYILKRALRRILGDDVLGRRKQMFTVPIGEWMRKDLANLTRAVLLGERARSRGWFDHRHVADLVKEHISGAKNFTRELRALLAIELWARIFLDEHHMKVPTMNDLGVEMTPAAP